MTELKKARDQCRKDLNLDSAPVSHKSLQWAKRCFVCAKWMTWDRRFQDVRGRLDADAFLRDGKARFGGYDAVLLWQAYPRIGFDDRNQFDFYRELPGGLSDLNQTVKKLHRGGMKVFVAYNPWDVGTRREKTTDGPALRAMIDAIGADGVFLDTLHQSDDDLRTALVLGENPTALESELDLPPPAIADHALSWMQWPPNHLGVLRNHWLNPGHMQHVIRRWHSDHRHEMYLAWLNGAGMLVWENIFGSWNGWSAEDAQMVRAIRAFFHAYTDVAESGEHRPCVPLWKGGIWSSEWNNGDIGIWTLANPTDRYIPVEPISKGLYDGFTGEEIKKPLVMPPGSIRAFATKSRRDLVPDSPASMLQPVIKSIPFEPAKGSAVPFGMAEVRAPACTMTGKYRVRECGDYAYANFNNQNYPGLHSIQTVSQVLPELHFAIDIEEVSVAQFREFLTATKHPYNLELNKDDHAPMVNVDIDDARAYAKWRGKRLPTEWEWQVAALQDKVHRATPLVWNMTESEHSDGITGFIWLKGGCEKKVVGSDWYADGGHQEPDFQAKFIRISKELDRCTTIGFRCAMDL